MTLFGTIIAAAIFAATIALKLRYACSSPASRSLFCFCMGAGTVMLLSAQTFDSILLTVFSLAECVLCVLLLCAYRACLIKECAMAAERRHSRARRRARAEQRLGERNRRELLASFANAA